MSFLISFNQIILGYVYKTDKRVAHQRKFPGFQDSPFSSDLQFWEHRYEGEDGIDRYYNKACAICHVFT